MPPTKPSKKRHRISAEHGHDISKYLADLQAKEKPNADQLKLGEELLAKRKAERTKYPTPSSEAMALHDQPKP